MAERCGNCRFWKMMLELEGCCRRYPPVTIMSKEVPCDSQPMTDRDAWCGEWSPDAETTKALMEQM
jgi:hypothetical protein